MKLKEAARGRALWRRALMLALATLLASLGVVTPARPAAAASRVWVQTFEQTSGAVDPVNCFWTQAPPGPYSHGCDFGGELYAGRNYVYCKVWSNYASGYSQYINNHWWLKTDVDRLYPGYHNPLWVNAYVLTGPKNSSNDTAFDVNGREIPNC